MNKSNKQKSVGKFFILSLLCATLAHAQGPEQTWLKGARTMDGSRATAIALNLPVQPLLVTPGLPAQVFSGAPAYRGETKTQSLTLRANQSNEFTIPMEISIYRVWTEKVWTQELVTTWDYVCREEPGPGQGKGDWKGFFNAPQHEKANRLADAIKGIGGSSAQCIVTNNLLQSKPRSWSQFKAVMRSASNVCNRDIYHNVVSQYGEENAANLGYYSRESCSLQPVTEYAWVEREVEHKDFDHSVRRTFHVRAQGGQYLPSESETVNFSYDGLGEPKIETTSGWGGALNRYRVERRSDSDYALVSNGRNQVKPSNSIALEIKSHPSGAFVRITDRDYIPGLDNEQAQTVVTIVAKKERIGPDKTLRETKILLQDGKSDRSLASLLGPDIEPGDKYYFEYRLERQNSRFNNSSKSAEKESAKQIQ